MKMLTYHSWRQHVRYSAIRTLPLGAPRHTFFFLRVPGNHDRDVSERRTFETM